MRITRRLFIPLAVVIPLAGPLPDTAPAGGFDVYACERAVADGANNSFASLADTGMAAYSECPAGQGIVARNGWDNGWTGWLQGAYMIFDAPPGTVVDRIDYDAGWERHNCSYSVGLVASGFDLAGTVIWGAPANTSCGIGESPGPTNFYPFRFSYAVGTPRVRIESRCGAASCPRDGISAIRIRNVRVRVRDDTAPTLNAGRGDLWTSSAWLSGMRSIGFDASDGAGIQEAVIRVDDRDMLLRTFRCDYTYRTPCPSASIETPVNTAGLGGDGRHTVTLRAVDAGGNPATVSRTFLVDNTAPDAPQGLAVEGGEGWRSSNAFDVTWMLPGQAQASPIVGAEYELCAAEPNGKCVRDSRAGRDITGLPKLSVPDDGAYTLRAWLRDEAGNEDRRLAAPPVTLRFDGASPDLAFEPVSGDDPTRLVVVTSDKGSGVVSGQIEMRRQGAATWSALPTTLEDGRLVARYDDEYLGDGTFEFRARATDAAGNERSSDRRSDGRRAEVVLPLRLKTALRAGVVLRRGAKAKLARTARVGYGRVVRISGRLTSDPGNPLQGYPVQVFSQVRGGAAGPRLLATVKTSMTGRFSFLVYKGPNRILRLRYPGSALIRSTTRYVTVNVRSRTTIRSDRRSYPNGEYMRLRGTVRTGRIPRTGKLLELQVKIRGRWRTFATTRTSRTGRWRYDYRFDGTHSRVIYRFRARIPREEGYPFMTGGSRTIRVAVRPR